MEKKNTAPGKGGKYPRLPAKKKSHLIITLSLSLYGILLAAFAPHPAPDRYLCAAAMLLSSLGDIVLMNFRPVTDRLRLHGFVAGGAVFGISHIIYAAGFAVLNLVRGGSFSNAGLLAAVAVWAALIIFGAFRYRDAGGSKPLFLPVAGYLTLICADCASVWAAAVSLGGLRWISAAGIFLFLASDLFIFFDKLLGVRTKNNDLAIWILYPAGQFLLLTGG